MLGDVPAALPALTRAVKLQDKAARVGFDWPSLAPVFDKLKEELGELEQVVGDDSKPVGSSPDRAKIEEEFGDLLFVVANVARHLKIDPEAALRSANQKFIRRFGRIEAAAGRRRPRARAIDARGDGSTLGPGQGRGARLPSPRPREEG